MGNTESEPRPPITYSPTNRRVRQPAVGGATAARRTELPLVNPFDVSAPYAAAMRTALLLALLPGLGTGLLLVSIAGLRVPLSVGWPQLAQAHGHIQTSGSLVLFIVAVGMQLFPRFLGTPLRHAHRAAWGSAAVALALVARLIGQPLPDGPLRFALLALAAIGVPTGVLIAGSAFHELRQGKAAAAGGAAGAWRRFIAVGGLALGGSLLLYAWSGVSLAAGSIVVPPATDEALVHLELTGFATSLVLAVASRVFGRFLLLRTRPALERRIPILALLWGAGLLLTSLGWLIGSAWLRLAGALVEAGVILSWLWLVGLYLTPSRESGTPYVTNPTRRWVRLAFAFLVVSVALQVGLFSREVVLGVSPSIAELSAARHALGQGFLLPLMVAMAARLLPIFSADVLKHRLRLELTVDLLLIGALVRIFAELLAGYGPLGGPLVALGGTLTVVGFAVFAAGMWSSLGRLPKPAR